MAATTGPAPVDDTDRLAGMFRFFARNEYAGVSPLLARLAEEVADRPDLSRPLLAAPVGQQRAVLYFSAVAYLLRTVAAGHPLAAWHPSLGGTRPATDGDPLAALTDLLASYPAEFTALCATRTTQTNEPNRAALLRPAFGRVAGAYGGRPLALLELGTSAGVLLVPDRYAYRYRGPARDGGYGQGLPLDCDLRGGGWPEPAGVPLALASRTGIDLSPIDAADPAATAWLYACVWPEQTHRVARLEAALAEVATVGPELVAGDIVATLPGVLDRLDASAVPCVFASHALVYLGDEARAEVVRILDAAGRRRDLAFVLNEGTGTRPNLFTTEAPIGDQVPLRTAITVVTWRDGAASVEVIGSGCPHGSWLLFEPRHYAYRPPSLEP